MSATVGFDFDFSPAPQGRHNRAKTHCPRQHAYTEGNLVPSQLARGARQCLTCQRVTTRIFNCGETWDKALVYAARRWPEMVLAAGLS